ncbi:lysophospholipid transporter LplT [Azotosporobacter soli]|uniref:lysophospholipid transporter LplT n=1 Tax=Azotosporobacter soli TaxID=3055040 RepID=UPI0031FE4EEB
MPKASAFNALLSAQFLSAFVDNMILFIVLAIIRRDSYPDFYLPFVQSTFLAAYIIWSPWVGRFADKHPKASVLMIGNAIKGFGVILLLLHSNPAVSYGVIGLGAAVYSPAKYGILPLLTNSEAELLRANSKLESFTILAILLGSVGGGFLSSLSVTLSLTLGVLLYGISFALNALIPKDAGNPAIRYQNAVGQFFGDTAHLLRQSPSHYSLIGTGSFWLASAVLRMIIFAWLPLTLGITSSASISLIIAVTGIGITIGAAVTPLLISLQHYQRTLWFGLGMGIAILGLLAVDTLPPTLLLLLFIGALGGIYIVPMNAVLQQVGHHSIGAGKTIAVQNFIENTFMFAGVFAYTWASKSQIATNTCLAASGIAFLLLVLYLFLYARRK